MFCNEIILICGLTLILMNHHREWIMQILEQVMSSQICFDIVVVLGCVLIAYLDKSSRMPMKIDSKVHRDRELKSSMQIPGKFAYPGDTLTPVGPRFGSCGLPSLNGLIVSSGRAGLPMIPVVCGPLGTTCLVDAGSQV